MIIKTRYSPKDYASFCHSRTIFLHSERGTTRLHSKTTIMHKNYNNQDCHIAYATAIGLGYDVLSPDPVLVVALEEERTVTAVLTRFGALDLMTIELGKRDIAHNLNLSAAEKAMEVIASMTSCLLARIPCEATIAISEAGSIGIAGAGDASKPLCRLIEGKTTLETYTEPYLESVVARGDSIIRAQRHKLPFIRKNFFRKIIYKS